MRSCPVCSDPSRDSLCSPYGTRGWSLFQCNTCGMKYLDHPIENQASLTKYYQTEYKTDDAPYSEQRLNDLADFVVNVLPPGKILDVGGKDGVLLGKLISRGGLATSCDAGDEISGEYGTIVLSHVLEHVYDMGEFMGVVLGALSVRGRGVVVVEVPIWHPNTDFLLYDYHWQHINKFSPNTLEMLFWDWGLNVVHSEPLPDYREYHCHRLVAFQEK
jgi:hypothetical protein